MKKIFLALFITLFAYANEVVKVGISANYAPFDMMVDGKLSGFDVDLVNEISKVANLKIEFVNMSFDGLIPSLVAGKINMIASGMSISERRMKNCDFSNPYFFGKTMYLKRKGDIFTTKEDLKGVKTGVKLGTIQENTARKLGANVILHEDSAVVVMSLVNKQIDAVVFDSFVAKKFMAKNPEIESFYEENDGALGFAFAFAKDKNKDLIDIINKALEEVKASGKYDELIKKYGL
ncbi:transporter substrate-binding domain-containing protein [Campylobacter sp. RM12640]|uniref:transporter substrate-binding domain-containing protein n=1 Tax=unclassified Campylobacter TaxID=2593542 RepID=UPI001BD9C647|nr:MULTISPECIES: transporter substrate-binding domain-containing protein [unclassified Campylobacter]MBZ7976529.1 transporter substrate-binding domain-containing protein [Campylobacter sp. RM12637]MBZ7981412.1 transporter substrate-binding domain-containing protein [Campylobacter sp. RM12640]MBZ7988992.1 transporter substrate-binding domain-containing protein [Campylobacter sp. RM12635]MBT0878527.1 transporter substrate-binding domain-containing protein [Campylobacter sp. 2018MI01]ULO03036.1 a